MSEAWVCPFCPLHCEDVTFGDDLRPLVPCDRLGVSMKSLGRPRHRINDDFVDWSTIARWVFQQSFGDPIVVRASTSTLAQSKTLLRWHQENRIRLTIDRTDVESAMMSVLSRDAMITATLGDVRSHADFVWILGNPPSDHDGRAFSRLNRWISESATVIHGAAIEPESIQKITSEVLRQRPSDDEVASAMLNAKYIAVIVGPGALSSQDQSSIVTAELINDLVRRLNSQSIVGRTRRAVIVCLKSNSTLDTVSLWQTNSKPNPSSDASIGWGTISCQSTISSHSAPIGDLSPVRLQIGGVDPGADLAYAFVATQIAGVDYADVTVRGDSSVTLPLAVLGEKQSSQFADARIGLDLPQDAFERLFHR
jgi:hypothetical protein